MPANSEISIALDDIWVGDVSQCHWKVACLERENGIMFVWLQRESDGGGRHSVTVQDLVRFYTPAI